jgi:hypothetical protein
MRLIDNKVERIFDKVSNSIYWGQHNAWISNGYIWCGQSMNILSLTNSDYLIDGIYHEIDS